MYTPFQECSEITFFNWLHFLTFEKYESIFNLEKMNFSFNPIYKFSARFFSSLPKSSFTPFKKFSY